MSEIFGNLATVVWLIAAIGLFIAEAVTVMLVSIWFAIGALFAMVIAAAGLPVWFQILVFLAVSGILLLATKPLVKKFMVKKVEKTNADRVLEKTAVVREEINNVLGKGQVDIAGQIWSARSEDGSILPTGTMVQVLSISGVKVIVRKLDGTEAPAAK